MDVPPLPAEAGTSKSAMRTLLGHSCNLYYSILHSPLFFIPPIIPHYHLLLESAMTVCPPLTLDQYFATIFPFLLFLPTWNSAMLFTAALDILKNKT